MKLRETFLEELADIYDAEKQLVQALQEHLEQTKEHVTRLDQVFEFFEKKAKAKKCKAMQGLVAEGKDLIDEDAGDAALISAAQKVEHYEIAAYGSLLSWAKLLGEEDAADLLEETLDEEKETDEQLTQIAESAINPEQEAEEGEEEEEKESKGKRGVRAR